jgi:hypothetical protein
LYEAFCSCSIGITGKGLFIIGILPHIVAAINPIIYIFLTKDLRRALRKAVLAPKKWLSRRRVGMTKATTVCIAISYLKVCSTHYAVRTMQYALCSTHYAVRSTHYAVRTMHYALCTMHYALCTMHYAVRTMQYALCSTHYALCSTTAAILQGRKVYASLLPGLYCFALQDRQCMHVRSIYFWLP